jgi:hypothetical protein
MQGSVAGAANGKLTSDNLGNGSKTFRVPSILVQLFWSATVGPWILWKIRGVNDVHSWAWQTRLAVVAGYVAASSLHTLC